MAKTVVYGYCTADTKAICGIEACKQDLLRQDRSSHLIYVDMLLRTEHVGDLAKVTKPLNVVVQGHDYAAIPRLPTGLCSATSIVSLSMSAIRLESIPNEIARLRNLESFDISWNLRLNTISGAVGMLPKLVKLCMIGSRPWIMPSTFLRLGDRVDLEKTEIEFFVEKHCENIRVFSYEFAEVCFGLQDMDLPALVTLEILDALCPNAVPMHKKWDLIVAVKHFQH